jgi:calpain-15
MADLPKDLKLKNATPIDCPIKFNVVSMKAYQEKKDGSMSTEWVVTNDHPFCPFRIAFNFRGSKACKTSTGSDSVVAVIPPGTVKKATEVNSTSKDYDLKVSFSYNFLDPPDNIIEEEKARLKRESQKLWSHLKSKGLTPDSPIEKLVAECKSINIKYIDPDFPPEEKSIHTMKKNPLPVKAVFWRRPEEFTPGGVFTIFSQVLPQDVAQGALGDCWLACAISALAEFPPVIKRMFVTQTPNWAGVLRLKFFSENDDAPTIITLDSLMPCKYNGLTPLFCRNARADDDEEVKNKAVDYEIWVSVLEKAYAKLNGNYFALISGSPTDAFSDLTGAPCEDYDLEDPRCQQMVKNGKFWDRLANWDNWSCVIAAGITGQAKTKGLVSGHAYALTQAREANGIKLVKLRNPWGNFEWQGDWGDNSSLWTNETIKAFGATFDPDDGMFYMSYEDFLKNFDNINVCMATTPQVGVKFWDQERGDGFFDDKKWPYTCTNMFDFQCKTSTKAWVSIFQEDPRVPGAPDPIEIAALVQNEKTDQVVGYTGCRAKNRNNRFMKTIPAGQYRVIPFTLGWGFQNSTNYNKKYVVGMHCDAADITLVAKKGTADEENDARERLMEQLGQQHDIGDGDLLYTLTSQYCGQIAIGRADGASGPAHFKCNFAESTNCKPISGTWDVEIDLQPGETKIIKELGCLDFSRPVTYMWRVKKN